MADNTSYEFFIEDVLLPVNPAKMVCKYSNKNETTTLISGAEINILKEAGLTEFSFEALLPAHPYPFAQYENGFQPVEYYLKMLKEIKQANKPIKFKVVRRTGTGEFTFDTDDFPCTLEDYQYTEDANEGLDVIISVTLKGYRQYVTDSKCVGIVEKTDDTEGESITKVVVETNRSTTKEVPSATNKQKHIVKEGESTWSIARQVYRNEKKANDIARKNKITNPNDLRAGRVIILE